MQDSKVYDLKTLFERLAHNQHRQLVLFCGSQTWAATELNALIVDVKSSLTLSSYSRFNKAQWPEHLHQILGQEFEIAIYDGYSGIIPNKLAALSGTVKAGGILALVLPDLSQLDSWCDVGIETWQNHEQILNNSFFLKRWKSLFACLPISIISEQAPCSIHLPILRAAERKSSRLTEQTDILEQISLLLENSKPQHILLTADRGRGKSAALGLLAGKLTNKNFIICSRQFQAVKNCFKHLALILGVDHIEHEKQLSNLEYYPPDQLLAGHFENKIILIDEAASLPVPTLVALAEKFSHCVFSSTLIGYEGNGRGYTLKFQKYLAQKQPHFKTYNLTTPIRYTDNDPLEKSMNQLFALDAHYHSPDALNRLEFCTLSIEELLGDEYLLKQTFALLVLAHYQTTVNDLRQLLDQPQLKLFIIKQAHALLGVCMVCLEGGLSPVSVNAIAAQRRRPKGHMLAQQLYHQLQQVEFLSEKSARIVRIAIAPEFQGQHLGSRLLKFVEQQLSSEVKYFGSSFGCTNTLLKFWQNAGFQLVKLGFKQDKSSGEYAALVVKSEQLQGSLALLKALFESQFPYQLLNQYKYLHFELAANILMTKQEEEVNILQRQHLKSLTAQPAHIEQGLAQIWQIILQNPRLLKHLSKFSQQLAIGLVCQNQPKVFIQQALNIDSKKQLNQCLHKLAEELRDALLIM